MNQAGLEIGRELTKTHGDTTWVLRVVATGFMVEVGEATTIGRVFASLSAAGSHILGGRTVNGWTFFGLTNPNPVRRTREGITTPTCQATPAKGKCKTEGCYEPRDCKHGFCHQHCTHPHRIGSYARRSYPRTDALHVGVEIEVVYGDAAAHKRGCTIDCHQDGSLGQYGAEYKLLALATEAAQVAADLAEELWKRQARVTTKCGLHVHLDVRQLSGERISKMLDWFQAAQEVFFGLVPPSRRNNNYAVRLDTHNRAAHRTWAHTTSYSTVEIRIHGGTLNPFKLIGWLTALIHVQAKANDATYTFPATGDATEDFWTLFDDCPAAGKEYLRARINAGGQLRDAAYSAVED